MRQRSPRQNDRVPPTDRLGLTLLEIILALVIATTIAMIGLHFIRPTGRHARQNACDLTRQTVQLEAHRYQRQHGRLPRRDLRQLHHQDHFPVGVPACPAGGAAYRLQGEVVICPDHEATRVP